MAISVALGPGTKLVAESMSMKYSRDSQFRLRTVSVSISAMCAAGPPKEMVPNFRNRVATSHRRRRDGCALSLMRLSS